MFEQMKELLQWAEYGYTASQKLGVFTLGHLGPKEVLERVVTLAEEATCKECRGYGTAGIAIPRFCTACEGTGNVFKKTFR